MHLTENRLRRNGVWTMWYVADNHNYMCHIYAKEFLDSNLKQSLTKYQFFMKWPQISHTQNNRNFKSTIIGT